VRGWIAGAALALGCLTSVLPAAAVEPGELMRPCKRHDLIGMWRVMRVNVPRGSQVDRTDPTYLPHQRYVFHSNATMTHATQDVPFTPEAQRDLTRAPTSVTWAMESEGRLVRQREGVAAVEKADCRVVTRAVRVSGTTQLTAQVGDILLTDERSDQHPATRRLLRRVRGLPE
jgi:hypothetical protein